MGTSLDCFPVGDPDRLIRRAIPMIRAIAPAISVVVWSIWDNMGIVAFRPG